MNRVLQLIVGITLAGFTLAGFAGSGEDAGDTSRRWTDSAEFSYVQAGGNAETQTLGFKNEYEYTWPRAVFTCSGGGLKTESTKVLQRYAQGSDSDYEVVEVKETDTTAENYYLKGKFDRNITKRLFWYTAGGWDRNEFAGIRNRYSGSGGLGTIWVQRPALTFRTDYGLQLTREEQLYPAADTDETYAAVRFSYKLQWRLFAASRCSQDFEAVINAEETRDFRASLQSSLSTSLNRHLALKVGLQLQYDNSPALKEIKLFPDEYSPENPGPGSSGEVSYEFDELDYLFTTALVLTF
jgi:putative salt-induced outer membrane protein